MIKGFNQFLLNINQSIFNLSHLTISERFLKGIDNFFNVINYL